MDEWLRAARTYGAQYRRVSRHPAICFRAQLGPALISGMSTRVIGEDGHGLNRHNVVTYRHPPAANVDD